LIITESSAIERWLNFFNETGKVIKLRTILICVALMASAVSSYAQQLSVNVTDNDGKPVELAYVNIYNLERVLQQTEQTNEAGVATLNLNSFPVKVEIVAAGFESAVRQFDAYPGTASVDFTITKKYASLNEVVVTGASYPERLKDALSSYQVITRAEIEAQGAVTLNEALKNQLNIRVGNDEILGSNLSMQGMQGNKVKILIDGLPLNGREAGNINLSQINMNNVERIEMIQGPMSVVYGTDALGGVINVITKKNSKPFDLNLGWYFETVGKYNLDGTLGFKLNKRSHVSLGGGRNYFDGWKYMDTAIVENGERLLLQRYMLFKPIEQYIANAAYNYTTPSGFKLNVASDYLDERVTNRGPVNTWNYFSGARAYDEYYRTKRLMNRASAEGKLGKTGAWQSQNGYFIYYRTRTRVEKDLVTMSETPTLGKGDQDTSTFKNIYLRGNYANKAYDFDYSFGYDINIEDAQSLKISGKHKSLQDYAVYTTIARHFIDNALTVQVGVRAAANSAYAPPVIPSVNLLYKPTEKLQLRASYTEGFRAPSLKEQYLSFIDQNHYIIGSLDLKAEKGHHLQVSGSYQVFEQQADYLQFIVTGYYNNVYDGIVLIKVHPEDTTDNQYIYGNLQHQENIIGSLQVDGRWSNLHYRAGYTLNRTMGETGRYNSFSASEATATLQYSWRKPAVTFNLFYKLTGAQPFLMAGIDGTVSYSGRQDAYHFMDASVERKFYKNRLQLIAGVKNILDIQTPRTTGVQMQSTSHGGQGVGSFLPRSFFTSLRFNID
jgi:outer membrane receptor for ferrienterochelin and colicins